MPDILTMKVEGAEDKPSLQETFEQKAAIQRSGVFPIVNLIIGDNKNHKCVSTQEEEQRKQLALIILAAFALTLLDTGEVAKFPPFAWEYDPSRD